MAELALKEKDEALSQSGYQGETLQVFVFYRGQYLGFQCFAQDRIAVGGTSRMDLYLPDCSEEDGHWGFSVSGGELSAWLRQPGVGIGPATGDPPRRVEPMDIFQLGEYRLQIKILQSQGFSLHYKDLRKKVDEEVTSAIGNGDLPPEEELPRDVYEIAGVSGTSREDTTETGPAVVEEKAAAPFLEPEPVNTTDTTDVYEVSPQEGDITAPHEILEVSPGAEVSFEVQQDLADPSPAVFEMAGTSTEVEEADDYGNDEIRLSETGPDSDACTLIEEETETGAQDPPDAGRELEKGDSVEVPEDPGLESFLLEKAREGDLGSTEHQAQADTGIEAETKETLEEMPSDTDEEVLLLEQGQEREGVVSEQGYLVDALEEARGEDEDDAWEDEDYEWADEEDEEENGDEPEEYFSLLRHIFPHREGEPVALETNERAVEIVRFRAGDVQEVEYLEGKGSFSIRQGWTRKLWKHQGGPPPEFKMVRTNKEGLVELHVRDGIEGRLYSSAGSIDIRERGTAEQKERKKGKDKFSQVMAADTWAVLRVEPFRYLVRYIPKRPEPQVQDLRPRLDRSQVKLVSASLLCHLVLIVMVGLLVPAKTLEGYSRQDRFARVDPQMLKTLKPPPPKAPKKPKAKLDMTRPTNKPKRVAKKHAIKPKQTTRTPTAATRQASGGGKKEVDLSQAGLLGALGAPGGGGQGAATGQSQILLAAVTNLDAVAVPSGASTFNLAGIAGKLETSEIQVPTSDVIETVGVNELMKASGGSLGALASKGTGTGQVQGIVHDTPKTKISIRGGMSREAVLKVVTAHLDEVRDCYERELLHNPGLTGKILIEWLIQKDGGVRYAKVKFNNMGQSTDLDICIPAQIRGWTFPRPKNNQEVVVTFPFLFESLGF